MKWFEFAMIFFIFIFVFVMFRSVSGRRIWRTWRRWGFQGGVFMSVLRWGFRHCWTLLPHRWGTSYWSQKRGTLFLISQKNTNFFFVSIDGIWVFLIEFIRKKKRYELCLGSFGYWWRTLKVEEMCMECS